jgi:hypothetical protein
MALIPLGYAQANLKFTGTALPFGAQSTFGIALQGSSVSPSDLALAVENAWDLAGFNAILGNGNDLSSILVKYGPTVTGPSAEISVTNTAGGGLCGPPNVTWLARKVTLDGGRAGRGRIYLPGVPEDVVGSDGDLDNTQVAALQTAFNNFQAKLESDSFALTVLHGPGAPITSPSAIESFQVDGRAATQRRRLRP